jgi:hypothetical protein
MAILSYVNNATGEILQQSRLIRYAGGDLPFGQQNQITLNVRFAFDVQHVSLMADVYARQMFMHRSVMDYKRMFGPRSEYWLKELHHTFVYDHVRSIYFGLNSYKMLTPPINTFSYPGHILLRKYLYNSAFRFSIDDGQPISVTVNISIPERDALTVIEPFLRKYPELREGLSLDPNQVRYANTKYEAALEGIKNQVQYLNAKKSEDNKNLMHILPADTEELDTFLISDSNPIANSFLSNGGKKFSFIFPSEKATPNVLRFNESTFLPSAIGITSDPKQSLVMGNQIYKTVDRNPIQDLMISNQLYSITGLKSDILPNSEEGINHYIYHKKSFEPSFPLDEDNFEDDDLP